MNSALVRTLTLCLVAFSFAPGCSNKPSEDVDESLKIEKKFNLSRRHKQIEIDNDFIESRKNSFARDEILPPASEPIEGNLYQSYSLVEKDKHEEAIAGLLEEIKNSPKNSRAVSYLGKVFRDKENFTEALKHFTRAIKLAPDDPFPYCLRAELYYSQESYKEAVDDAIKALAQNPDYGHALAIRGESYLQLGKYNQAIKDLKLASELNPKYAPLLVDLGDANMNISNFDEAVKQYTKAIELDKENGMYYARRAKALKAQGKVEESKADLVHSEKLGFNENYKKITN